MFQPVKAVGNLGVRCPGVVQFRNLPGQVLQFLLDGAQFGKNRRALGENRAPRQCKSILWKITRRDAFGHGNRAVVKRLQSSKDFHQRRFAGAVRAHQTEAVMGRDQPIHILKQQLVTVALSSTRQLDHGILFIVS